MSFKDDKIPHYSYFGVDNFQIHTYQVTPHTINIYIS